MSESRTISYGSFFAMAIIFIVLKLAHVISWPWVWVLSPLWIPIGLFFAFAALMICLSFLALAVTHKN